MKAKRKAAAQNERQNTTVQLEASATNSAIAPPKLQKRAERNTSEAPSARPPLSESGAASGFTMASAAPIPLLPCQPAHRADTRR